MRKFLVKMAIKLLHKYAGACKDMGLNSVIYFYGEVFVVTGACVEKYAHGSSKLRLNAVGITEVLK